MDVACLLTPVSEDLPCGEDLEYDPQFLHLERAAVGQPERSMGDAVLAAEPPQWREISQLSEQLLQRSKDLRICHFLLQGALAVEGLRGLADTLSLVQRLLENHWAGLHPLLDADDDNDPTLRLNALVGLASETTLNLLRDTPLIRSRAFGAISLRAAANASGLQHFQGESLGGDQLRGALQDSDPEQLEATRQALDEARQALQGIEQQVAAQLGVAQGVDLSALDRPLKLARQILGSAAESGEADDSAPPVASEEPAQVHHLPTPPRSSGQIDNRDDVQQSLQRILDYYARHEPSSPVPVLLNRARQLVSADFAAIVRNLIPDGMSQFENLRGPDAE
ncbi:type VI secretion system protein TssA [Pseudomonas sp. TE3610]